MNSISRFTLRSLAVRTAVAAAAVAACSAASALPAFTFNPAAVGLAGTAFTADNLLISDYATVTATSTGFTETGFLSITGAQLGQNTFTPTGLSSTYGLYIQFSASATNTFLSPNFNFGSLDSLSYTLYGYNGTSMFSPTSAPAPLVTLGSGSLVTGTFTGTTSMGQVTSANANANLTFTKAAAASAFFVSPVTFYGLAQAAFNNTTSEITTTSTGFVVTQGGGSVNFLAAPVPEPETYALMLGGLAAVGFLARRRSNG